MQARDDAAVVCGRTWGSQSGGAGREAADRPCHRPGTSGRPRMARLQGGPTARPEHHWRPGWCRINSCCSRRNLHLKCASGVCCSASLYLPLGRWVPLVAWLEGAPSAAHAAARWCTLHAEQQLRIDPQVLKTGPPSQLSPDSPRIRVTASQATAPCPTGHLPAPQGWWLPWWTGCRAPRRRQRPGPLPAPHLMGGKLGGRQDGTLS